MMDSRWNLVLGLALFIAAIASVHAAAQASPDPAPNPVTTTLQGPVDLNWTPPALTQLGAQATTRSSFALDRNELAIAAGLTGGNDPDTKQAIAKIDGINVHLLRFGPAGIGDEASVEAIRDAYHLRGWKHLVTTEAANKSPLHNGTTDLWLVLDGVNVRGAVVLVETPRSVTLATMAGNLSPVDMLHLRGHFGIPRFEGSDFKEAHDK
ncbi:MAG: hypothetical protein ABR976_11515 [Terracidiphilus sp.]|jgi:hypothetical protein